MFFRPQRLFCGDFGAGNSHPKCAKRKEAYYTRDNSGKIAKIREKVREKRDGAEGS